MSTTLLGRKHRLRVWSYLAREHPPTGEPFFITEVAEQSGVRSNDVAREVQVLRGAGLVECLGTHVGGRVKFFTTVASPLWEFAARFEDQLEGAEAQRHASAPRTPRTPV